MNRTMFFFLLGGAFPVLGALLGLVVGYFLTR